MRIRKRPRFDFKPVIPIPASNTLSQIAANRQRPRFPLFDNVAILVEHQPRISKEVHGTPAQVDSTSPGSGDRTSMQPHEQRMLKDLNMMHWTLEQRFQRSTDGLR